MGTEEKIVDLLGDYVSCISLTEEQKELTPEQKEFYQAADVCLEILKRTRLISGIVIKRPDEFKEAWEKDKPEFDFMSKYAISTCEIADEVMKKIRE